MQLFSPPLPEPEVCVYGDSDASHFPPPRHPFPLSSKAAIVVERLIRLAIRKKGAVSPEGRRGTEKMTAQRKESEARGGYAVHTHTHTSCAGLTAS